MTIAGVYLAAGAGKRMGESKVDAELAPGFCLGSPGLRAVLSAGLDRVAVVVRPGDPLGWMPSDLVGGSVGTACSIVVCEDAAEGMARSLQCGLSGVVPEAPNAILVALADQPFVTVELLRGLVRYWTANCELDYVVSGYDGVAVSPPAVLSRSMFPSIARLQGDQGAKRLMASGHFIGQVMRAMEPEWLMDVDTPEELVTARQYARKLNVI